MCPGERSSGAKVVVTLEEAMGRPSLGRTWRERAAALRPAVLDPLVTRPLRRAGTRLQGPMHTGERSPRLKASSAGWLPSAVAVRMSWQALQAESLLLLMGMDVIALAILILQVRAATPRVGPASRAHSEALGQHWDGLHVLVRRAGATLSA